MSNSDILKTALNAIAPEGEQIDALSQAHQQFKPGYVPDMAAFIEENRIKFELEKSMEMAKSLKYSMNADYPSNAVQHGWEGMQSVRIDDVNVNAYGPFLDKGNGLSFDSMRQIVSRTPVLGAVILTRIRQIKRFCHVSPDGRAPGFQIRFRDRSKKITKEHKRVISQLESFILNNGWEFNPRQRQKLHRDNFGSFISKIVRDSLTMDSAPIETEFALNKNKGMAGFYAVDGATVRLCSEFGYEGNDEIFAVQVVDGQIRTLYTHDELIYTPRNATSDIHNSGYGVSEIELLVRVVTGFLNAMSYNLSYFDDNKIPKGILHLVGDYSSEDISAFKRLWNSMLKGVQNTWSLPILASKNKASAVNFEKLNADISDVQFSKWMSFLTSIICAIYGMAPDEINFESFTASNTSALSGSDTEEKIINSKDKGLIPLFSYLQELVSDFIVSGFSSELEFVWCGLDQKESKQLWTEESTLLTVNEARTQRGWDPLDWGDVPMNANLQAAQQAYEQKKAEEQQAKEAELAGDSRDYGMPGKRDRPNPLFQQEPAMNGKPLDTKPGQPNTPPNEVEEVSGKPDAYSFGGDEDEEGMVKSFGFPLMRTI